MPSIQDDTNAERQRRYRERRRTGGAKPLELYLPPDVTAALEAMGTGETPRRRIEAAIIALVTGAKRTAAAAPGVSNVVTVTPPSGATVAVGMLVYTTRILSIGTLGAPNVKRRTESARITRLDETWAYLADGEKLYRRDLEMARAARSKDRGLLRRLDRDADAGQLEAALEAAHRAQRVEAGNRRRAKIPELRRKMQREHPDRGGDPEKFRKASTEFRRVAGRNKRR